MEMKYDITKLTHAEQQSHICSAIQRYSKDGNLQSNFILLSIIMHLYPVVRVTRCTFSTHDLVRI